MSDVLEKKKWINKLLNSQKRNANIFNKGYLSSYKYNAYYYIDSIVYFESKVWYHFRKHIEYYSDDEIIKTKITHLLVNFGHHQPNVKAVASYYRQKINYGYYSDMIEEIIEFDNEDQLPSTRIPIEDIVDIVYNSAINTKAVNIQQNNIEAQIKNTNVNMIVNDVFKALLPNDTINTVFADTINTNILQQMLCDFGSTEISDSSDIFNISERAPYIKNITDTDHKFIRYDNMPALHCKKKQKSKKKYNPIHHIKNHNDSDVKKYKTLVIGHGVRIGALLNTQLFKERHSTFNVYYNGIKILSNMHHNSIEVDNHWQYINSYNGKINEQSVDKDFIDPRFTDKNEQALYNYNITLQIPLKLNIESSLSTIINNSNATINKLMNETAINYTTIKNIFDVFLNNYQFDSNGNNDE